MDLLPYSYPPAPPTRVLQYGFIPVNDCIP